MSTTPIVRRLNSPKEKVKTLVKEITNRDAKQLQSSDSETDSNESSDSSGGKNFYMEFDSSSDEGTSNAAFELQSLTTKSSDKQVKNPPLITELASKNFD